VTTLPPRPVIIDAQGFKVFAKPNGRYSHAVKVNGRQVYARDYQAGALPVDDGLVEPDDGDFIAALVRQRIGR
jgi:hypothetical protein